MLSYSLSRSIENSFCG